MDITTKSVEELKALAYDLLVQLEQIQGNLRIVNNEIASRAKPKEEVKEEK